jgi:asparagine synthase (glutamine-hydrolysing)
MCGIAGGVSQQNLRGAVEAALLDLSHRGPDSSAQTRIAGRSGDSAFLGISRLAMVDVSGGHQPYFSETKEFAAVFNGEIYNHESLRQDLEARGHTFNSRADGEVIPHLYEEFGEDFSSKLEGMFAIAIFDKKSGSLVLSRDRFGEKPLYYLVSGFNAFFASQLTALSKLSPSGFGELDRQSAANLLTFGFVPSGASIYEKVKSVPAGANVVVKDGSITLKQWWSPNYCSAKEVNFRSRHQRETAVEDALRKSVQSRIPGEVPWGLLLSGGIDSSLVASLVAENGSTNVPAFAMKFSDDSIDESKIAVRTARALGLTPVVVEFPSELATLWDEYIRLFDEPNLDSSALPMIAISQAAAAEVRVALSGDGGDELFGGYPKYQMAQTLSMLNFSNRGPSPKLKGMPERAKRYLSIFDSATRGLIELSNELNQQYFFSWENPIGLPRIDRAESGLAVDRNKALWLDLDLQGYLPGILQKVDVSSMGSSLEVRSAFLNFELYDLARSLDGKDLFGSGETKRLLRSIAKKRLGVDLSALPKRGFSPHRAKILDWVLLNRQLVFGGGKSNFEQVFGLFLPEEFWPSLLANRPSSDRKIWALVVFEEWLTRHFSKIR